MIRSVKLSELAVWDDYPRQNVNERHVSELMRAMEGGHHLPPIVVGNVVGKKSKKFFIVDGVHRYNASSRLDAKTISADVKVYKTGDEMFKEAVLLNCVHGMRLDTYDTLRVIKIAEDKYQLKEIDLATMLRTSIQHLRAIKPRYANLKEAVDGVAQLRKIPLKASVRHLSGQTITKQQEQSIFSAPGQSYLLTVNQLIDALKDNLIPEKDDHPVLWERLEVLLLLLKKAIP